MRNLKKFLALVLAFMMVMSLMLTANAATKYEDLNFSDSNSVTAEFLEDIQVLAGMDVIKGYDDGSFQPKYEINRGQMAAIIYRIATGDVTDSRAQYWIGYNPFPDVHDDDYYAGYIGYCASAGYIAGFTDGTFKPMNKVTGYQALAMILRAMGYNHEGDNFTGDDWQSQVSSRAKSNNMLVNIEKTIYNGTFGKAAPRELVAEMTFQGLIQPQVTWTTAFGYQRYGMEGGVLTSVLNPTLGYENFGLTHHKGVVVGNTASGEPNLADGTEEGAPATKIGFSLDTRVNTGIQVGDGIDPDNGGLTWEVVGTEMSASINDKVDPEAYYYLTSNTANGTDNVAEKNVTLSFRWESDLSLFNHAVDVWYDCRGNGSSQTVEYTTGTVNPKTVSASFKDNLTTYAVFDRATTSVGTAGYTIDGTDGDLSKVFGAGAGTFFNYAFAGMTVTNKAVGTTIPSVTAESPIQANNGKGTYTEPGVGDAYPLYLAIDNTGNKKADVIISLDMTMTKVVQDNNTQKPLTTGVLSENGAGTAYFDLWDQVSPYNGAPDYSDIADDNMRSSDSNLTLGKYVSAITVTGTAPNGNWATATTPNNGIKDATASVGEAIPGDATQGCASNATGMKSTYYYQVNELTKKVTGSMVKYDQTTDKVWVNVGGTVQEIERSVFALATDGSFQIHEHVFAPRNTGTFTFYLDQNDNWIFWEEDDNSAEFVYGTYINYTTSEFGGLFDYPFVYVSKTGEGNQKGYVSYLDTNGDIAGKLGGISDFDGTMNNDGYTIVQLPKRTNTGDNSSGFVPGMYVGYAMSKNEQNGTVGIDANLANTGFLQATSATGNFGESGKTTTINSDSVAISAHPVTDEGNLFLTERTKFVIVDGAGTETQKVEIYQGIGNLLTKNGTEKNTDVVIDASTALTVGTNSFLAENITGNLADIDDPWLMVYYSTEEDPYSQNYDMTDKHIDTVFIPKALVEWSAESADGNLYFVGDNKHGLIDAGTDATQFTFYQGTEEHVLWIAGQYGGSNARANANANVVGDQTGITTKDTFYWLYDTGEKAVDGEPIYTINTAASTPANADTTLIGYYWNGTARTAAVKTATITGNQSGEDGKTYLATTRNAQVAWIGGRTVTGGFLFNVNGATVKNLNGSYIINSLQDLNEASSNTSNLGIAVSCVIGEKGIANIYVNFVSATVS